MSITSARSYFRARCNTLGFKEWKDGFNLDNIPSTILNRSYHITQGIISGVSLNQNDQVMDFPITVELFTKGYKDVASAIDSSIELTEDLIIECVKPANRLTQTTGIKNIIFESATFDQLDNTNDNSIIAKLNFRVITILGL